MANDFRILVGFADDRKTKRLVALLGEGGIRQLLRLFEFTREKRPKGVLTQLDRAAIGEVASGKTVGHDITQAEAEAITDALKSAGFLDRRRNGSYEVHDWDEINPYAYFAPERRKRAQTAAKVRWSKRDKELAACSQQNLALLDASDSNAPSPTPSPTPIPEEAAPAPPVAPRVLKKIQEADKAKSDMRQVTDHWMATYAAAAKERGWQLEKYNFGKGKDGKILAELIRQYGAEKVIGIISDFFSSDDEWVIQHGGFTVGVFKSQINKLSQRPAAARPDPARTEYASLYRTFLAEQGRGGPFDVGRFIEFCRARQAPDQVMALIDRELVTKEKIGAA